MNQFPLLIRVANFKPQTQKDKRKFDYRNIKWKKLKSSGRQFSISISFTPLFHRQRHPQQPFFATNCIISASRQKILSRGGLNNFSWEIIFPAPEKRLENFVKYIYLLDNPTESRNVIEPKLEIN